MKLRLRGQASVDWQVVPAVRGGGSDPKWTTDAVKSFPFSFRPSAALRELLLEVEVWNEDPEGVDTCTGTATYDVTSLTRWSTSESSPVSVELRTARGEPCGELVLSAASEVDGSEDDASAPPLTPEHTERISFLKSVPLFHECTEEQLAVLVQRLTVRACDSGSVVVRQGDIGDEFFVLASGGVRPPPITIVCVHVLLCVQGVRLCDSVQPCVTSCGRCVTRRSPFGSG